ncbi:MAG: hypothetical protein R2697_21065 [Ilumatobacteraceae bacterium]
MAEAVVDDLELVDVDEQHRDVVDLGGRQPVGELVHHERPVRQARQLVVACGIPELGGRPALLGDVLDVGDRQHLAVVLGGRHAGACPHELAVAPAVPLVDPERVDDAEFEPGAVRLGGTDVVGVREFAECAPDQLVDVVAQHVGE